MAAATQLGGSESAEVNGDKEAALTEAALTEAAFDAATKKLFASCASSKEEGRWRNRDSLAALEGRKNHDDDNDDDDDDHGSGNGGGSRTSVRCLRLRKSVAQRLGSRGGGGERGGSGGGDGGGGGGGVEGKKRKGGGKRENSKSNKDNEVVFEYSSNREKRIENHNKQLAIYQRVSN